VFKADVQRSLSTDSCSRLRLACHKLLNFHSRIHTSSAPPPVSVLATGIVFRSKMHKTLHFYLKIQKVTTEKGLCPFPRPQCQPVGVHSTLLLFSVNCHCECLSHSFSVKWRTVCWFVMTRTWRVYQLQSQQLLYMHGPRFSQYTLYIIQCCIDVSTAGWTMTSCSACDRHLTYVP